MRMARTLAFTLTVLLASQLGAGCNMLRTPYERQKIAESGEAGKSGGSDKAADTAGQGGEKKEGGEKQQGGGGEEKEGGGGEAKTSGKNPKGQRQDPQEEKVDPDRAETKAERAERLKGQGVLFVLPNFLPKPNVGGGKEQAQPEKQQKQQKKGQAQSAKSKGDDPLQQMKAQQEDKNVRLQYNRALSSAVAKIEGIDGAIVLLDDQHQAYVALSAGESGANKEKTVQENKKLNVKSEGEVPTAMQEKVTKTLRTTDPLVSTVHLTNDPEHLKSFLRYATQLQNGETSGMSTQALADHIEDIWKQ